MYRATKFLKNRETGICTKNDQKEYSVSLYAAVENCWYPWYSEPEIQDCPVFWPRDLGYFERNRWIRWIVGMVFGDDEVAKIPENKNGPGQPPWYIRFAGDGLPGNPVKSTRFFGINCSVYESNVTLFKSRGNTKRGKIDICGISIAKSWCRCK